jgi:hypothetical protein
MTHSRYPIALEKEGKQSHAYSENSPGVCGRTASVDEASISFLDTIRLYIPQCNRTGKKTGRAVPAARTVHSETVSVAIDQMPNAGEPLLFSRRFAKP